MKRTRTFSSGQTLLELVLALGVIAVVLTGLVSAVTSSLRYSQSSQLRSRGVKYAQEGLELARKLRDSNTWDIFAAYSGSGSSSWCLSESGVWSPNGGSGCPIASGSTFWRTVTFTWNDPIMDVVSEVSWADRLASSTVSFRTYFSQWR